MVNLREDEFRTYGGRDCVTVHETRRAAKRNPRPAYGGYQLWGRDCGVLRERLLEAETPEAKLRVMESALLEHLVRAEDTDPVIRFAAQGFERGYPVSEVTSRLDLPPKTFVQRFRERRSASHAWGGCNGFWVDRDPGEADWSALAAEHGYADQAHLIHDFRDLTGMTPGTYRPRSAGERNRVPRCSFYLRKKQRGIQVAPFSVAWIMQRPTVNLEELSDLCTPWCVHVAATLRIADHIAAGIAGIDELAAAAKCDSNVLHSVLGHLVSKGVFEEPEPGRFSLNDAARGLLDPMLHLGLDLDSLGGRMAHAWGTLLRYVRTGAPAYHEVFGLPFWEDLDAHPEIGASFDTLIGPAGHGVPNPEFQIAGGWEPVRTVVDVGGGTGAMLAEILLTRPWVRGTLVDLPRAVARSGETFRSAGVSDRVATLGQSFFDPLPAGADLYLLRGVLNDWPDREAVVILSRCADAARPSGRVVVLKSVGPDGAPRRLFIEMVLLGGKQRSVGEFRELASRSGLEVVAAGRQECGYFVVECRPK